MVRRAGLLAPILAALSFAAALAPSPALAAPKVGVVVLSHEGLSDEVADQVAGEVAVAVATQIEGESRYGASVRDSLQNPPGEGCEDSSRCGRDTAAELGVDEALLLVMSVDGKTVTVECYRVPRDKSKPPTHRTLKLVPGKAKRAAAILDLVTGLYPTGTASEFAEAAPSHPPAKAKVPPPEEAAAASEEPPPPPAKRTHARAAAAEPESADEAKRKKKWLMYGLIGGGAAVLVAVAVILGVTLGTTGSPTGPAITLP
jgi:hypothetical protein